MQKHTKLSLSSWYFTMRGEAFEYSRLIPKEILLRASKRVNKSQRSSNLKEYFLSFTQVFDRNF